MRKFLIVSHGGMAGGVINTVNLFLGENHNFSSISAYMDDTRLEDQITDFLKTLSIEDELVILTDILGGSVNQKMVPLLDREGTHLIAGFNLPLILELSVLDESTKISSEMMKKLVEETKNSLTYVNESLKSVEFSSGDE